jgi:enterochelin esterase family protein
VNCRAGRHDADEVNAEATASLPSPVIEELPNGGFRVTVRYWDEAAEEVSVAGGLAGVDPGNRRMRRDEDGWWERTYELPRGVRCDYWFTTGRGLVVDPLNPLVHVYPPNPDDPEDPGGAVPLLELPGAPTRCWSVPPNPEHQGSVTAHRLRSELLDNERSVFTYTPPEYDPRTTYPLIVAFDGWGFTQEAYVPLPTVLDNLIAAGAIPPAVAVLPDSLDGTTRRRELFLHEPFVDFLAEELLPWAHERVSFNDDPSRTLVAGASLGGHAAAFCGLRRSDLFGLVVAQSAPFQRGLPREFAVHDRLPLRFALQVGWLETTAGGRRASTYHINLHMRDVLTAKGYEVAFAEYAGGHDYFWWRETIAEALIALLAQ